MWIPWTTRKENVFLIFMTGGEGKDQQEPLNLQHINYKQCGGHSKLPTCPFPYRNKIQSCSH